MSSNRTVIEVTGADVRLSAARPRVLGVAMRYATDGSALYEQRIVIGAP